MRELAEYRTPSGRTCTTRGGRPPFIAIDGEEATIERHEVLRDGGTEVYATDRGMLIFPRKLGISDRTPRLDGEPLTRDGRVPWEWVERQRMEEATRRRLAEAEGVPVPSVPRRALPSRPAFTRVLPSRPAVEPVRDEQAITREAWAALFGGPPPAAWRGKTDREVFGHLDDAVYARMCQLRVQVQS